MNKMEMHSPFSFAIRSYLDAFRERLGIASRGIIVAEASLFLVSCFSFPFDDVGKITRDPHLRN